MVVNEIVMRGYLEREMIGSVWMKKKQEQPEGKFVE